jgi:zinc protease
VRTAVTGASLREFFYELDRIRDEPVSTEEITNAKSYLTGVFPIRIETQDGLIDQLVNIKMLDLPDDYLRAYRDQVDAVTVEQIQAMAQKYVRPDQAAVVVVGDAGEISEQIKPYSEKIEVYDTDGNRKG